MSLPAARSATYKRLAGATLVAAAVGLGLVSRLAAPGAESATDWIGYRAILVDATISEPEIVASLGSAGVHEVVSVSSEPVLVSDWGGLESISLAEATRRLLPGDPRLDDYLQNLSLWFQARVGGISYRALYVKSNSVGPGAIARGLAAYRGKYYIPDASGDGSSPGDALSFFCAIALILASSSATSIFRRGSSSMSAFFLRGPGALALDRIALRIAAAIPWAMLAGRGLTAAAIAALWGIAITEAAGGLELPLEELRRASWRDARSRGGRSAQQAFIVLIHQGRPPVAVALVACLALFVAPGMMVSVAVSLIGSLLAVSGYALLTSRLGIRPRFVPMHIGLGRIRPNGASSTAAKIRAALAFACILAWGLSRIIPNQSGPNSGLDAVFPRPFAANGSLRPLLSEARRLAPSESGSTLPGIASFLEHRAIQEALPYVRVGEARPDAFAPALMPMPPGGSNAPEKSQGVEFSDDWARAVYRAVPALSIEGMLLAQGTATVGREAPSFGGDRPLAPIDLLLYIFLLVPLCGRLLVGVPFARDAASGELRQEA